MKCVPSPAPAQAGFTLTPMDRCDLTKRQGGFTLPELLVAVFILGTLTLSIIGLATLGTRTAFESERQTVALGLVNQHIERIRVLPYDSVGFTIPATGEPDGVLLKTETRTQNDQPYTITTGITLVDDPFNGPAGVVTEANADYKKVTITAAWRQASNIDRDLTAVTYVTKGAYATLPSPGFSPLPSGTPIPTPTPSPAAGAPPCLCPDGTACLANNTCCANCLATGCPAPEAGFTTGGMCYFTTWNCDPGNTQCTAAGGGCVATTNYYACYTPQPTSTVTPFPTPTTSPVTSLPPLP